MNFILLIKIKIFNHLNIKNINGGRLAKLKNMKILINEEFNSKLDKYLKLKFILNLLIVKIINIEIIEYRIK